MTVLLCPLCSQPRFNNLESLRLSLINAATQSISCPICNDVLMGLDKLTIHLFGHTLNQNPEMGENQACLELKLVKTDRNTTFTPESNNMEVQSTFINPNPPSCPSAAGTIPQFPLNTFIPSEEKVEKPMEKIEDHKEYLKNIDYDFAIAKPLPVEVESIKDANLCTVNMAELSFLTGAWENCVKSKQDLSKIESNYPSPKQSWCLDKDEAAQKEDSTELSEYMSELLNKKLPILNYVFTMDNVEKNNSSEKPDQSDKKPLKCSICGSCFQNIEILSLHEELMHSKKNEENVASAQVDVRFQAKPNIFSTKSEKNCKITQTEEKDEFLASSPHFVENEEVKNPGFAFETHSIDKNEDVYDESKDGTMPRYDCHLCPKSFKMKAGLLVHFKIYHFGSNTPESLPVIASPGSPDERSYQCSICSKSFKKVNKF